MKRRQLIKLSGSMALLSLQPDTIKSNAPENNGSFEISLNTSTISGQKLGLLKTINVAAQAGYNGVELWIPDIQEYLKSGNSIQSLASHIRSKKLKVYNLISFTHWMADDDNKRSAALQQLEDEMKLASVLGCRYIAAPPAGVEKGTLPDYAVIGKRYSHILDLGQKHKVTPVLEFWGASGTLYNISQAMAIAAYANHPDARILPDVYHMFRGGSGFETLKLLSGRAVELVHINDYPGNKPVDQQNDGDRVYPGDGVAPLPQILKDLKAMGGTKILSLELFNKNYWQQDALQVAKTGIDKIKTLLKTVG